MLSIIIPVFNEAESLPQLYGEISGVCRQRSEPYELIFVDDGSTDASWQAIQTLCDQDPCVSAIRFRRNFGKAAALTAGMRASQGDVFLMMDADLQDDPAEIPRFLSRLDEGYDVVNGWKVRRLDPWHKVYPSKVFNCAVSWLTGLPLHDHNCGFKCFRAQVASEIRLYGELHRFIPVLAFARGFRVSELDVNHRRRQYGYSKYGLRRFVRGFLDLLTVKFLTGYGQRPQHLLGAIGLLSFFLGALGLGYLAIVWLLTNGVQPWFDTWGVEGVNVRFERIGMRPLLVYSAAALLLGVQLVSLGFLAELIVAYMGRESETYSVAERIPARNEPPA